jgi:hypothetical protein
MIVAGLPADCVGSVHLAMAGLASVLDRWDDVERHMARALERSAELGNRPWTAVTRLEHARLLLRRGAPGDRERALAILDVCASEADAHGFTRVAALVDDLRAAS